MSKAFVAAIHAFVHAQGVPLITFEKGQRKDEVMAEHLAGFTAPQQRGHGGSAAVGRARPTTLDQTARSRLFPGALRAAHEPKLPRRHPRPQGREGRDRELIRIADHQRDDLGRNGRLD
jgi:hypothetical protein